ncbi:MarR family transcriptional regulator [Rhodococcus sp. SGAir0479]|uniref:MarR family transcriptional regulator n=1 Tax=Rhodococcus sp. SGAir0479 TaxID=2567884 RepID=UPI0010CCD12E|nr:MarR family transcriptional regulator [Rhodococcus sp. SGAir0479]QCQ93482.1 MarR family transcriptional regulator [Rhodococcus sp. SGAir0479]
MSDKGVIVADEVSVTVALLRAARVAAQAADEALAADDVTADHYLALDTLIDRPGATMAELRDRTRIPAPTLTRVVDRLVSIAAVYREVDADDRRRVRVHPSTRGRQLHARLSAAIRDVERDWLAELSDARSADLVRSLVALGRTDI